ncbi:MAG: MMPL family transporter [Nannocystaceae bacterium]
MGANREQRLRERWIDGVLRHHRTILIVACVLTVLSAWVASSLHVDSDLRRLLPRQHVVLKNLESIEENFSAIGSVNLVVAGASLGARHAFADAVAEELADHEFLSTVDYRLRGEFFLEHALYYLSEEDMSTLEERVAAWRNYEMCSAAPDLCLGLTKPDPKAPDRLRAFVDAQRQQARDRVGFEDYYERDGIDALVVLLLPTEPSSDLDFAVRVSKEMTRRVREIRERADRLWSGTDLRVNLVGPYIAKAAERAVIRRDMVRSGLFGVFGVVAVIYLFFRSWRAVLTLVIPLLCGVTWSLAAAQLVLGHLNTMTSLISSVVMGMGIDAGIHLFSRARRERDTHDSPEAIRRAFCGLIVPLLVASSTTAGAFLVMAQSDFPAFQEFGAIAAMGVVLCLLSMVTVFPAFLRLVGIKRVQRCQRAPAPARIVRFMLARPGAVFALLVAVTVFSAPAAGRMRQHGFEHNGRELQSDQARAGTESDVFLISKIFGKDVHAGILVLDSYGEAKRVYERAVKRHRQRSMVGDSVVADLFGAPSLMPDSTLDFDERAERIDELTEDFSDRLWKKLGVAGEDGGESGDSEDAGHGEGSGGERERVLSVRDAELMRKMLQAKPFGIDDLPAAVLAKVRTKDGKYGLFAYPNFDASNIRKGIEFMAETVAYRGDDESKLYVGETSVYAAMYQMIQDESPVILGMAGFLVAALVFWQLRSVGQTLLTLVPLLVGLWWMLGVMGSCEFKFTLFNVPILPAVLGIGVDNGVFLTAGIRYARGRSDGLAHAVDETGRAILAATVTTAIGFATFLIADSGGLRGIGMVAVLGISMTAGAAVLVLPTLSALGARRREQRTRSAVSNGESGGEDEPEA